MAKKAAARKATKRAQQKKPPAKKVAAKKRAAPAKKAVAQKKPRVAKVVQAKVPENRPETGDTPQEGAGRGGNVPPPEYRFAPGQSGNPGGRPKTKPLTDAYRAILNQKDPNDKEGRTYAEIIAMAQVKRAIEGDSRAVGEIADRVEGKVTQPISGPDEGPIDVKLSGMTPEERDRAMDDAAVRLGYRRA